MKGLSYSFLRAICALVIGLVLVMFPDQAGDYFVITIGVIFLVPSLISIIGYFAQSTEMRRRFPIEATHPYHLYKPYLHGQHRGRWPLRYQHRSSSPRR